jgi:hypothetical protein
MLDIVSRDKIFRSYIQEHAHYILQDDYRLTFAMLFTGFHMLIGSVLDKRDSLPVPTLLSTIAYHHLTPALASFISSIGNYYP